MRIGIFPGSFDPLTYGHLDIIERANKLCDKLIIAVAINRSKVSLFSIRERLDIIKSTCKEINGNFDVVSFEGLLVDYCKKNNVSFIIRGLRSVKDFEYETSIASINRKLSEDIESVFLISREEYSFISSNIIKEIASCRGDISSLVPQFVENKIHEKFS